MTAQTEMAPARRVVEAAQATNDDAGHENRGSLSYSYGFLPRREPMKALPAPYDAWNQIAADIPYLYRMYAVRKGVAELPLLSANDLPDAALTRAAALFGILAHVYWYSEPEAPENGIPPQIAEPWAQISARLDRPAPHLSFMDVNSNNWQFIDPEAPNPFRMENLRMAIPMVGNEDERRFQMTPVEMLYLFSPLMESMLSAQEAVLREDRHALGQALTEISDGLRYQTHAILPKVNPNPYSATYINPVVWGKTAALFASPFQQSDAPPGPSGTAIPSFTSLDIFFGRKSYRTTVGHETDRTRGWFPEHWRNWLNALETISVADYVQQRGDSTLRGIYAEARDAYAGESGILSRHRLKAYGFLDLSFKAGRVKTLGGFSGTYSERVWDRMANELDEARLERYGGPAQLTYHVPVKRVETLRDHEERSVQRVVFDIGQTGIRYQAGDRCGILPENSDALVEKTLAALLASGSEIIPLNARWRNHLGLRRGFEDKTELPLWVLLKFGHIRPVERAAALRLYALTNNERLRAVIDNWAEDQWELWDMLNLLAREGYNPRRLWRAIPGDAEHICQIIQPENWRLYSISSVMSHDADELHLTVGGLQYLTHDTEVSRADSRQGTGSTFLGHLAAGGAPLTETVTIKVVHPPRFNLPQDARRPIVMIAAGTGIAPMRSLISERIAGGATGANWLFFGTQERDDFHYRDEFADLVGSGKLDIRVAFSRDEAGVQFNRQTQGFDIVPGQARYLGAELLEPDNARLLWDMIRRPEDGGQGASLYICGRTAFANSMLDTIKTVIARYIETGNRETAEERARQMLYRLIGEDRLMLEIFTTYAGTHFEHGKPQFDMSDVSQHNNDEQGYWIVISGRVYEMREFNHIHPGGAKIIQSYSGMDGTLAYQKVEHHINPEVDSMLGMFELGVVRTPDFGQEWGVAVSDNGLRFVTLRDTYLAWTDLLQMLVEIENAVQNDFRVRYEPLTDIETHDSVLLTPSKVNQLGLAHERLVTGYLDHVLGAPIETLWSLTIGIAQRGDLDARWMKRLLHTVRSGDHALSTVKYAADLRASIKADEARMNGDPALTAARYAAVCDMLEREDRAVLRDLKSVLCQGAKLYETYQRDTIRLCGDQLVGLLQTIPLVLDRYYQRFSTPV